MSRIEDATRAYFDRVRAKDAAAIGAMYSAEGLIAPPGGEPIRGPAAIEAYYRKVFAGGSPNPEVQALAADGDLCFAEVVAHLADGTRARVVDLFTFDRDGRIAELAIYVGPGR